MTHITRRWLLAPVLLLAAAVLFVVVERVRGTLGLRHWEREMRARGEKFSMEELAPPLPNDPAIKLVSAEEARGLLTVATMPQSFPGTLTPAASGKARSLVSLDHWLDNDGKTNSWAELAPVLDSTLREIPALRATLTNQAFFIRLNYQEGFNLLLPQLAGYKTAAQAMNCATIRALHEGRFDEAFENLLAGTYATRLAEGDGVLISQLVRIACATITTAGLWEALQSDGFSDAQWAALQARWQQQEFMRAFASCLQMERALAATAYDGRQYSLRQLASMNGMGGPFGTGQEDSPRGEIAEMFRPLFDFLQPARRLALLAVWRMAWVQQDQLYHHEQMQRLIDTLRRQATERRIPTQPSKPDEDEFNVGSQFLAEGATGFYDRSRHWLALQIMPAFGNAGAKAERAEVLRELALAAIALKRHQLRHHRLPPTLEALVPEFLPRPPHDWYSGQPLHYQPNADGSFVLYSVGPNGSDDHGSGLDAKGDLRGLFAAPALDIVWPQKATPEEVAAAERESKPGRRNAKR